MARSLLYASLTSLLLLPACAGEDDFDDFDAPEQLGVCDGRIINGLPDTTHQAVVAVLMNGSACTGTIVHAEPGAAWVLTAAHCFAMGGAPVQIRQGNNYMNPDHIYSPESYQIHSQYNSTDNTYDFAMTKVMTFSTMPPVIPAMSPAEDNLNVGTTVDHVGYGLTSYPNGDTTVRHHVQGTIDQMAMLQFAYNQPTSGPCSGDSGGPNLSLGTERVAGVISYGDQTCSSFGVSGRVSAVYSSFIQWYITSTGGSSSSSSSTSSSSASSTSTSSTSTSSTSTSSTSTSSTSTSSTSTSSTSTSSTSTSSGGYEEGWVAGNVEDQRYGGEVVTACSVGEPGSTGGTPRAALWLLLLGLCGAAGRRRERSAP